MNASLPEFFHVFAADSRKRVSILKRCFRKLKYCEFPDNYFYTIIDSYEYDSFNPVRQINNIHLIIGQTMFYNLSSMEFIYLTDGSFIYIAFYNHPVSRIPDSYIGIIIFRQIYSSWFIG